MARNAMAISPIDASICHQMVREEDNFLLNPSLPIRNPCARRVGVRMKHTIVVCMALMLTGCVTETAQFKPLAGQETIVRDGQPALVSKKAKEITVEQTRNGGLSLSSRC